MKKFASVVLCLMLLLSMAVTGIVSVSAADENKGTITIQKYKDGTYDPDSTEEGKNVPVAGAEFTIYQVLELGEDGLYRVNTQFSGVNNLLTDLATANADSDGYLTYGNTEELEAKISELQKLAETPYGEAVTTNTDGAAIFSDVAYGVYLAVETKVPNGYTAATKSFLVSVNAEDPNPTAYPKNAEITTEKYIVSGNTETKKEVVAIGDTVNYKITSQVPTYDTDLLSEMKKADPENYSLIPYYFIDTMSSGLTFDSGSIKVKVGNDDFTQKCKVSELYYDVNGAPTLDVSIEHSTKLYAVMNWENLCDFDKETGEITANYMGKTVEITYTATLNKYAEITTGSKNYIDLVYTSDPASFNPEAYWDKNGDPDPDPILYPEPDPSDPNAPTVYTYEMDLTKKFNGAASVPDGTDATKVKFELTGSDDKKLFFVFDAVDNCYYTAESDTEGADSTLTVLADGTLKVRGIKDGTYVLTETATADGYTKLTSGITIVVEKNTNQDNNGNTILTNGVVKAMTYNANGEAVDLNDDGDGIFSLEVNNSKNQFSLPQTGGLGLWMFTIAGGIIMAVAIIYIGFLRRKAK